MATAGGCAPNPKKYLRGMHPNARSPRIKAMPHSSSLSATALGVPGRTETQAQTTAALRRCAQGDRPALRVVFDNEAAAMLGIAYRILRRRDLAEEIVQEAFVRVWRNAASYDPELGSVRSWLFAIVRNLALNALRDGRRELPLGDDAAGSEHEAHSMSGRLAENSALRRCLERLDENRRSCLLLAYVGGFSHGEIAGRLGAPLGTVKAWIRRGLQALRECMG